MSESQSKRVISLEGVKRKSGKYKQVKRYDEKSFPEYDYAVRNMIRESRDIFSDYGRFVASSYPVEWCEGCMIKYIPLTVEAVALADVNLRTRKLVGVVLGSNVPDLHCPPQDIIEINGHYDFDVLILNPHSPNNPSPNEWSIDWFVRPFVNGRFLAPTNGAIKTWYDIGLRDGVECTRDTFSEDGMKLRFNISGNEVVYDPNSAPQVERIRRIARDGVEKIEISPGLYLLDPVTMNRIADYCGDKEVARNLKVLEDIAKLRSDIDNMSVHIYTEYRRRFGEGIIFIVDKYLEVAIPYIKELDGRLQVLYDIYGEYYRKHFVDILSLFKNTQNNRSDVPSKMAESLKDRLQRLEGEIARKQGNYDYLRVREGGSENAVLPVIPDDLVYFKGL